MELRPILSTLRRHKTAASLIVLEIALSCAIICNALFLISQRLDNISRVSGFDETHIVRVQVGGIGTDDNAGSLTQTDLAHLDPMMLIATFALAIVASVLAGLVPAWHACQVTPAVQLKSQ